MSKSAIYTANVTAQSVTANEQIALGTTIRRFGQNIRMGANSITLNGCGYYKVISTVTLNPTNAGAYTLSLYNNGAAITGATATVTAAAADYVELTIVAMVRLMCSDPIGNLTLEVNDDTSITNVSVVVEKE